MSELLDKLVQKKNKDKGDFFAFNFYEHGYIKKNIEDLNYLLSLNSKKVEMEIWNEFPWRGYNIYPKLDKSLLSKKSRKFIEKYFKCWSEAQVANFNNYHNKDVVTERLMLTSGNEDDRKLFESHLKKDGDYIPFVNDLPTKEGIHTTSKLIYNNMELRNPPHLTFAIKLKKDKKTIGFIGIQGEFMNSTYELAYYIFKGYRKKGYAGEAIKAFVKVLFKNEFVYPCKTKWNNIYKTKPFNVDILRATPNEDNLASINLLKKLKFKYSGKDYGRRIHPVTHKHFSSQNYYIEK